MLYVEIVMCTVVGILILDHRVRLVVQIIDGAIIFYSMLIIMMVYNMYYIADEVR